MKKKLSIRLDETMSGHPQKKWLCPACNKKRFVRFYNFATNEYLDERFGRCDRSENCNYYLSPYKEEGFAPDANGFKAEFVPQAVKTNYVDRNIVTRTLQRYDENVLFVFLKSLVGEQRALEAMIRYYVGTAKDGGTIFWQVDSFMQVRTGQLMFYKPDGHRDKMKTPSKLFKVEDDYRSCLFGEHLLFEGNRDDVVAIVESEKTSLLASLYMPDVAGRKILWMACSGSNGLTHEKIACLRGRDVMLANDFSFHARATWGALPMRKKYVDKLIKGEVKQMYLPDPDGELVEYESAADRLRAIGCNVSFFDPYPETDDGSDIADTFVQESAPEEISMPEFGELSLPVAPEIIQGDLKPSDELSLSERIKLQLGRHSLKLAKKSHTEIEVRTNNVQVKNIVEEKFLQHEGFRNLIERFALEDGEVIFGE